MQTDLIMMINIMRSIKINKRN